MAMVEFTWTMNLPNEFMVDHTFTDGKTCQKVYDGPDKLYMIINNETGKQEGLRYGIRVSTQCFCPIPRLCKSNKVRVA